MTVTHTPSSSSSGGSPARPELPAVSGRSPAAFALRRPRNKLLPATLVGLLLGFVVLLGGVALVGKQQATYSATASLLVLPDRQASPDTVASLYDSLSSGQVVESYRAVMASPGFTNQAIASLRLSPREREGITPDVHVVPSTALVDVTVSAPAGDVAERVADQLAQRATSELSKTFTPYRITLVSPAAGTAAKSGPGSRTLIGVVVLLALVVAVAGQQAVLFVVNSRERSRNRRRRLRGVVSRQAAHSSAAQRPAAQRPAAQRPAGQSSGPPAAGA